MIFILREYTGSEVADLAVADNPAALLDGASLWGGCIWRVVAQHDSGADSEDVAVMDLTISGKGYNVFTHQTVSHVTHLKAAVRMVRNILQHYYESGKLDDHADLIGVRVSPA